MCFPGSSTVMTNAGPLALWEVQKLGGATIDTSPDFQTLQGDPWLWDVHASMGAQQGTVTRNGRRVDQFQSAWHLLPTGQHLFVQIASALKACDALCSWRLFVRLKPSSCQSRMRHRAVLCASLRTT